MTGRATTLGKICELKYGKSLPAPMRKPGHASVYGSNGKVGTHVHALLDGPAIVVGRKGSYGEVHYSEGPLWPIDTTYFIDKNSTDCDLTWLHYLLRFLPLTTLNKSAAIPGLNREDAYRLPVLVPPLEEQRRIASILNKVDKLCLMRQRSINLLDSLSHATFVDIFGSSIAGSSGFDRVKLQDFADVQVGFAFKSIEYSQSSNAIRLCRGANILPNQIDWSDLAKWPEDRIAEFQEYELREGDIVIAMDRPWISSGFKVARISRRDLPALLVQRVARLRPKNEEDGEFLFSLVRNPAFTSHFKPTETTIPHISPTEIRNFSFSPPEAQKTKTFATIAKRARKSASLAKVAYKDSEALFFSLQSLAFSGQL